MQKKILVVGGTGFIGREVVRVLSAKNIVFSTSQSVSKNIMGQRHFQIPYDESSFTAVLRDKKIDTVLFLSGNSYPGITHDNPLLEVEISTKPFIALLESVRKMSAETSVWLASSVAVYGANNSNPLTEKAECLPLSFYASAKLANEEYAKVYARAFGIQTGILRIFSTYGPGLRRQLVFDLMSKIFANPKEVTLFGDGTESRDLGFVTDQARAIAMLAETQNPSGDIYNIGSGKQYTVKEIFEMLCRLCNVNPMVVYQSRRGFDGANWCADINKIRSLGFHAEFDIERGLTETLKDFKSHVLSV